jgi:hypothetical protein
LKYPNAAVEGAGVRFRVYVEFTDAITNRIASRSPAAYEILPCKYPPTAVEGAGVRFRVYVEFTGAIVNRITKRSPAARNVVAPADGFTR